MPVVRVYGVVIDIVVAAEYVKTDKVDSEVLAHSGWIIYQRVMSPRGR